MKKKKKKFRRKLPIKKNKKNYQRKKYKKSKKKRRKPKTRKKRIKIVKRKKKVTQKTKVIILGLLRLNQRINKVFRINFNLDRSLQKFFQGISDKISNIKKLIREEKERQKRFKIQEMEREKKEIQKKIKVEKKNQ